jgi:ribosomal-protein-alanine N-acetyltransferase
MNLRTTRLFLRPIRVEDASALFAARGDPEVMRYWDWPAQKSVADVEEVFRNHIPEIDDGETKWWVVALSPDGPAIGECDLSEIDAHNARAELGFLFARAHWGKGYAREAAQAAMEYGFETLGLERLWARVHAGNDASARLLKKLGFAYEGTLKGHVVRDGVRRDCLIYGRLRAG